MNIFNYGKNRRGEEKIMIEADDETITELAAIKAVAKLKQIKIFNKVYHHDLSFSPTKTRLKLSTV